MCTAAVLDTTLWRTPKGKDGLRAACLIQTSMKETVGVIRQARAHKFQQRFTLVCLRVCVYFASSCVCKLARVSASVCVCVFVLHDGL